MRNKTLLKAGTAALCLCLAAGGAAGWYFGSYTKDFKITKGDMFSEVYKGDFCENLPYTDYLHTDTVPTEQKIFDIREYGASPDSENNRDAVQTALDSAAESGGVVFVGGGRYVTGLVRLVRCQNVTVENFMLQNSAAWTLELNGCDGVQIRDFVIDNNRHVANTDGIDVAGSSNVEIAHCFIATGDDGIVLKNSKSLGIQSAMENIAVRDCKISSCTNAFKIGTETSFDIQNVLAEDCEFFLEDIYPGGVSGISLESADGAQVRNITVRNVQMRGEACPLFISLNNRNRDKDFDAAGALENITVENIQAEDAEIPVIITGTKALTVRNITLRNFDIRYADGKDYYDYRPFVPVYDDTYPECNRMRNLNAYGLFARYAEDVKLESFAVVPRDDTKRKEILLKDVADFERN